MAIIPSTERLPYLQPFLEQCHLRQYPARSAIIHAGDASDSLFFIVNRIAFRYGGGGWLVASKEAER